MAGIDAVLERRREERRELLERARSFVARLDSSLGIRAAVVFGSVARGDFNRWSDVDLLLIGDGFRGDPRRRLDELGPRPPRVRPVAWMPEEWRSELDRGNPIALEARRDGVWLVGSPRSL